VIKRAVLSGSIRAPLNLRLNILTGKLTNLAILLGIAVMCIYGTMGVENGTIK